MTRPAFVFVCLACLLPPALADAKTVDHVVLIAGNAVGASRCEIAGPKRDCVFRYMERGETKIASKVTLNTAGYPQILNVTKTNGNGETSEVFSTANGVATWKSAADAGRTPSHGDAFYVSTSDYPDEWRNLARVLIANAAHRSALLPGGEASLQQGPTVTVSAHGMQTRVTGYIIFYDIQPMPIWLSQDGELFGLGDDLFFTILSGWESGVAPRDVEIRRRCSGYLRDVLLQRNGFVCT